MCCSVQTKLFSLPTFDYILVWFLDSRHNILLSEVCVVHINTLTLVLQNKKKAYQYCFMICKKGQGKLQIFFWKTGKSQGIFIFWKSQGKVRGKWPYHPKVRENRQTLKLNAVFTQTPCSHIFMQL